MGLQKIPHLGPLSPIEKHSHYGVNACGTPHSADRIAMAQSTRDQGQRCHML